MKPPPFSYHVPSTIEEVTGLLDKLENAKLLAGGQSLMPMLNMRFVLPDHVIDLNRVEALAGITQTGDELRIGAVTRQRALEDSQVIKDRLPLLTEALTQVGHRQTRNRGTIGGSLCHLDPAAEQVSVCTALDATIEIAGPNGIRAIPMAEFPQSYMTPNIEPNELVTAIKIKLPQAGHGYCFTEFARRHGDFAIVSVAILLTMAGDRIGKASVTLGGVGAAPLRMAEAESLLTSSAPGADLFKKAAETARGIDAMEDAQVPAWYRQQLATVLMERALTKAFERTKRAA